jgi:L-asparaginase
MILFGSNVRDNEILYVDREIISQNVKNAKEDQILITHGTDTMVETAAVLAAGVKEKTVVLTGAMIP